MTRFITITSGKGGVGKTNLGINLALQLAEAGFRACLFDADLGLANINVLLGIYPEYTLKDVILGDRLFPEIIVNYAGGVDIIPGSSGIEALADLSPEGIEALVTSFQALAGYDFILFDTSAGISKDVIAFCMASPEVLLVLTPEPTSLTDGYALVKVLKRNDYTGRVRVVLNQCKNGQHAKLAYGKFRSAVKKFLDLDVALAGVVYADSMVPHAVAQQKPLMSLYPKTSAAQCIRTLADRLVSKKEMHGETIAARTFWEQCIAFFRKPMKYGSQALSDMKTALPASGDVSPVAPKPVKTDPAVSSAGAEQQGGREAPEETVALRLPQPTVLEKMGETLNGIMTELALLRQAIENIDFGSSAGNASADSGTSAYAPEPMILDFDAFLKQRRDNGKER